MADAWENNTTRTWAEESTWSPKRDKTQFSVDEQEQEKALINGFQKNLVLNESENMCEDCSFCLRTGCLGAGIFQGVKEKEGGELEEQQGKIPCEFLWSYMKKKITFLKESKTKGLAAKTGKMECKGSIFGSARTKLPLSSPAVNNITKTADTSTYLQQHKECAERHSEVNLNVITS